MRLSTYEYGAGTTQTVRETVREIRHRLAIADFARNRPGSSTDAGANEPTSGTDAIGGPHNCDQASYGGT